LPDLTTVKTICADDQLRIGSLCLESHNYQPQGNSRLYRYTGDLFGSPENLERFIYLSQVTQARAAKQFVEHLRAHRKENNGVMFCHLNDCTPAISYSAIDHLKNKKALYYYAKRFFAARLITVIRRFEKKDSDQLDSLQAIAVNDHPEFLTAALKCSLLDMSGNIIDQMDRPFTVSPFDASTPVSLPRNFVAPENPQKSFLHLVLENDDRKIAENTFLYMPDKYIEYVSPQIEKDLARISEKQWALTLSSSVLVKDVHLESDTDAVFSDNFFDLLPSDRLTITVTLSESQTQQPVISLRNINNRQAYQPS